MRLIFLHNLACVFHDAAFLLSDSHVKQLLCADAARVNKWSQTPESTILKLNMALREPSFRSVFFYRIKNGHRFLPRSLTSIGQLLLPRVKTIEIGGKIGGGVYVSHNFSVIFPERAGDNLRVGPGVVIGRVGERSPKIGSNVYIAANSTVIGNVEIGNNVIIGAGSLVCKSIPSNSVVVGNPAHVIRSISEKDMNEIS
ncbi:serine O-acetyltransferase [Bifidobacterium pullorum]|uniref:serine O-acetyltransferase n=1 Tax=Bifidobacterium pullorum TaxID=78448 RepID=UPI0009E0991B|nr:hypothetical protein [Bifidobacterium pullorum]